MVHCTLYYDEVARLLNFMKNQYIKKHDQELFLSEVKSSITVLYLKEEGVKNGIFYKIKERNKE